MQTFNCTAEYIRAILAGTKTRLYLTCHVQPPTEHVDHARLSAIVDSTTPSEVGLYRWGIMLGDVTTWRAVSSPFPAPVKVGERIRFSETWASMPIDVEITRISTKRFACVWLWDITFCLVAPKHVRA
jgi:hypothetical protein